MCATGMPVFQPGEVKVCGISTFQPDCIDLEGLFWIWSEHPCCYIKIPLQWIKFEHSFSNYSIFLNLSRYSFAISEYRYIDKLAIELDPSKHIRSLKYKLKCTLILLAYQPSFFSTAYSFIHLLAKRISGRYFGWI